MDDRSAGEEGARGGEEGVESSGDALDWDSVLRELKGRRPDIAAVYKEATVEGFDDGTLKLAFPEDLAIYVKLAGEPKRAKPLQEILEERLGFRPDLELLIAGADGPAAVRTTKAPTAKAPVEGANGGTSSARGRPPQLPPESLDTSSIEAPWPEEPPYSAEARGVEASSGPGVGGDGGEREGADNIIRDPQEVLDIARDLFGPGGGLPEDKQDRDS